MNIKGCPCSWCGLCDIDYNGQINCNLYQEWLNQIESEDEDENRVENNK